MARRLRREHPLRTGAAGLLSRVAGRRRLVRLRSALMLQERERALLAAEQTRLTTLSDALEAAADDGLLTPSRLDDILREAT